MDCFKDVKICFLADRHDLYDDRIYWKMAVPMKKLGAEVHYYLIGPQSDEGRTPEGIEYRMWALKAYSKNTFVNFAIKRVNPLNNYEKIYEACVELKADVYHFHDLWLNRIAPRLKSLPHRPVVFYDAREPYAEDYRSLHDSGRLSKMLVGIFASWVDRWEKKKASNYDLVIANEPKVRQEFANAIGEERAVVLYNYLDRTLFAGDLKGVTPSAETAGFSDNPQFTYHYKRYDLIYCGLLTQKRGAWKLLEAIRGLKPGIPKLKVLLLGKIDPPGLRQEMQSFIRRHDLNHTIEIKGQVPYEQVGKYYRASRIGLLLWQPVSSLKIKMPIKLFEYMAFGLPVVGSNFGHIADLIEKESCGITVNPENPEEVAEAIESLMRQEKMYKALRNNGIEAAREKYNWQREFDNLCNHYKKALDER